MTPELTEFQKVTETVLQQRLHARGLVMSNRALSGAVEPFIVAEVEGVKIWIYANEACVVGRGVDRVFEVWDYDSPSKLREAFVNQILDLTIKESKREEHL